MGVDNETLYILALIHQRWGGGGGGRVTSPQRFGCNNILRKKDIEMKFWLVVNELTTPWDITDQHVARHPDKITRNIR